VEKLFKSEFHPPHFIHGGESGNGSFFLGSVELGRRGEFLFFFFFFSLLEIQKKLRTKLENFSKLSKAHKIGRIGKYHFFTANLENNDKNLEIIAKLLKTQIWKEVDFFYRCKSGKN
jgi:hypothetical protein